MYLVKVPNIIRRLTSKYIHWQIKTDEKVLYYTFDDGPIPGLTPKILEILESYNAKATFFMVGDNIRKHPEIYEQVKEAGHATGNHSYNHIKGWSNSNFSYYKNIIQASKEHKTNLLRPPYGQISYRQSKVLARRFNIILWTVLSGDYDKSTSPEKCLSNIINSAKSGSIIVMHDNIKAEANVLFALEESLKYYSGLGYSFKSLSELNE